MSLIYRFKTYLYKKSFKKILQSSCPTRIPRTGAEGERIDCYTLELRQDSRPFLLVSAINENVVTGYAWANQSYSEEKSLPLSEALQLDIKISHFYGLYEIQFNSIYEYALNYLPYMRIKYDKFTRFRYNKTNPFIILKRKELLDLIVRHHLDTGGEQFTSYKIMELMHTSKWANHPHGQASHEKLKIYINSFVTTGELEKSSNVGIAYIVKGQALKTLEDYEVDERRHQESLSLQSRLTLLTVIITAITALIQYNQLFP
jgi:hypothetical protein